MPSGIRPTQDKVRKALFDILGDVQGLSFLELFAGSGAVGIEALSQGAREVVFVEQNKKCVKALKESMSLIGLSGFRIVELEAQEAIRRLGKVGKKFQIIFLDPPYYEDWPKKILQMLGAYDILTHCGYVVTQHFKKDNLPEVSGDLRLFKQARYGDTALSFYRKSNQ